MYWKLAVGPIVKPPFFAIIASGDENVEDAATSASVGAAKKRGPMRAVSARASCYGRVQVKSVAEHRRVEAEAAAIDIKASAVGEIGIGVGVAGG